MAAEQKDPRKPVVDKDPGQGSFDERTQETTPWKGANERQAVDKRPDPIVVPEGERRSEEVKEEPKKEVKSKSQERREAAQKSDAKATEGDKTGKKNKDPVK